MKDWILLVLWNEIVDICQLYDWRWNTERTSKLLKNWGKENIQILQPICVSKKLWLLAADEAWESTGGGFLVHNLGFYGFFPSMLDFIIT